MHQESSGFKRLIYLHVEKIGFGVIVLLFGLLIYTGIGGNGLEQQKEKPSALQQLAKSAQNNIDTDRWDSTLRKEEDRVPPTHLKERAEQGRIPTEPVAYAWKQTLKPVTRLPNQAKRRDPKLFAPIELETYAAVGPIAVLAKADPLADFPNSVAEQPAPEEMAPAEPEDDLLGGPRQRRPGRSRRNRDEDDDGGLLNSGPEASPLAGPGFMPGGVGGEMGDGRQADPRTKLVGYRPGDAGGASPDGPAFVRGGNRGQDAVTASQSANIVAIKALVPIKKQMDEFDRALKGAFGYDPVRDSVTILFFHAQRVDVTDDPGKQLTEADWPTGASMYVSHTTFARDKLPTLGKWEGSPQERVKKSYLNPAVTMPVPPLMLMPLDDLFLHSKTPKAQLGPEGDFNPGDMAEDGDQPQDNVGPAAPSNNPEIGLPVTSNGNFGGGPGDPRMGVGADMENPAFAGPAGPAMGGENFVQEVPEFSLLRFFDMSAESGHKYRYRVRVLYVDPNRPQDPTKDPSERNLAPEVIARLAKVAADEARASGGSAQRTTFYRNSEWSDPSPVVSVPSSAIQVFAGSVTAPDTLDIRDETRAVTGQLEKSERRGNLVVVEWDKQFATYVPGLKEDVVRGTMLDFTADADIVHPVTLAIKKKSAHSFRSGAFVADLMGGVILVESDKDPLKSPGEFAVVNADGSISVRSELDDLESYRQHTYAWEKDQHEAEAGMMGIQPADGGLPAGADLDGLMPQPRRSRRNRGDF